MVADFIWIVHEEEIFLTTKKEDAGEKHTIL